MSFLFPFCVSTSEELQIVASNLSVFMASIYSLKRDKTEDEKSKK